MLRGIALFCFCSIASLAFAGTPMSTGFTYQGELNASGGPATGPFDFEFRLFDQPAPDGTHFGTVFVNEVSVQAGVFSVSLDFGVSPFNGDARWLEIRVRGTGTGGFTILEPRQPITAAPYALQTRGIFVDSEGEVGIGTEDPTHTLQVESDNAGGAVHALNTSNFFGGATGVYGESMQSSGRGLHGLASSDTGGNRGVFGESRSASGTGVYGLSRGIGVEGESTGTATGVKGSSRGGSGVSGTSSGVGGIGVRAYGSSLSGEIYGLWAGTNSPAGTAVYAQAGQGGPGISYAVYADNFVSDGYAGFFKGRFRVLHEGVDFNGPPFDDATIAGVRWPVSIENEDQPAFRAGLRMSDLGFFEVTNKAHEKSPNFARLDSTGNWTIVSDRRMKKDLRPLSGALDRTMALEPISFRYNRETPSAHPQIGFTAQNVQAQFPSLVTDGEVLTLNYSGLSVVAIAAIQEQQRTIAALKAENASLHERLDRIEQRLNAVRP